MEDLWKANSLTCDDGLGALGHYGGVRQVRGPKQAAARHVQHLEGQEGRGQSSVQKKSGGVRLGAKCGGWRACSEPKHEKGHPIDLGALRECGGDGTQGEGEAEKHEFLAQVCGPKQAAASGGEERARSEQQ